MKYVLGFSMMAVVIAAPAAASADVPAQLFNKTITSSFSVGMTAKGADGSTMAGARSVQKIIYISNTGRIFVQTSRREGRNAEKVERGPEVTGNAFRYDGARLIGTLIVGNGASQLSIGFDGGFQSCTAEVRMAGQNGRPVTWKGLNGITYTSTGPATVSNPSCSIQTGNAFSG